MSVREIKYLLPDARAQWSFSRVKTWSEDGSDEDTRGSSRGGGAGVLTVEETVHLGGDSSVRGIRRVPLETLERRLRVHLYHVGVLRTRGPSWIHWGRGPHVRNWSIDDQEPHCRLDNP